MSKIASAFLAYRFTGEDPTKLEPMLKGVIDSLASAGVDSYCTFFQEENFKAKNLNPRGIMEHAFEMIEKRDALLVIQTSNEKSEGMLLEVGKFFGTKPIIVATHASVSKTYLPDLADQSFRYETQKELEAGFIESLTLLALSKKFY